MSRKKILAMLLALGYSVTAFPVSHANGQSLDPPRKSGRNKPSGASHPVTVNGRKMKVRLTVYWSDGSGTDHWSRQGVSSTGAPLVHGVSAAVDPNDIPYGSVLRFPNFGDLTPRVAVDTGGDVKKRKASGGKYPVVDLYFTNKEDALAFANAGHNLITEIEVTAPQKRPDRQLLSDIQLASDPVKAGRQVGIF